MSNFEKPTETSRIVLLTYNREVLLLRRPDTSNSRPGEWEPPGGKIDPDETPRKGGVRECREETGISVDPLDCQPLYAVTDDDAGQKFSRYYLMAALAKPEEPELTEHIDSTWVSLERADRLVTFGHHLQALQLLRFLQK